MSAMSDSSSVSVAIYRPDADELVAQSSSFYCSVDSCRRTFRHARALHFHMVKTHKLVQNTSDAAILNSKKAPEPAPAGRSKFFCPEKNCWNHTSIPFSTLKRLKEHYVNVHAVKKFVCPNCQLGFGFERALKRHRQAVCGITYDCGGCSVSFNSKTSMQSHCKKKKHELGRVIKDEYNALSTVGGAVNTNNSRVGLPVTSLEIGTCTTRNAGTGTGTHDSATSPASTTSRTIYDSNGSVSNSQSRTPVDSARMMTSTSMNTTFYPASGTDFGTTTNGATPSVIDGNTQTGGVTPMEHNSNINTPSVNAAQPVIIINVMKVFCADPSLPEFIRGREGQRTIWPKVGDKSPGKDLDDAEGPLITCSTQTSGDYILERAMNRAEIPLISKVSTGSQVSPKSRVKSGKSVKSACVQTSAKKRKRIQATRLQPLPSVDDIFCLSDVETQTNTLIEELQASLGASISTQTKDSFLATNTERPAYALPFAGMPQPPPPLSVHLPQEFLTSSGTDPMPQQNYLIPNPNELRLSPLEASFNLGTHFHSNQTQTMDSMFEQLWNNMETQTPFTDFGFGIDNETQTVAPQSVETQTSLHGRVQAGNNVQSTSIETQTMATDFDPSLFEFAQLISGMQ